MGREASTSPPASAGHGTSGSTLGNYSLRSQAAPTEPTAPHTLPPSPVSPLRHPAPRRGPPRLSTRYVPSSPRPPRTGGLAGPADAADSPEATRGQLSGSRRLRYRPPVSPHRDAPHPLAAAIPLSAGPRLSAPPRRASPTNPRRSPPRSAPPDWRSALDPWAEEPEWARRSQRPPGGRGATPATCHGVAPLREGRGHC